MGGIHELGREGEDFAATYLKAKGYVILKRNYRYKSKEIDIIAKKDEICVFVEVKTRSGYIHEEPERAVGIKKQRFLIEAANYFLIRNDIELESRFDVITIKKTNTRTALNHIENAFQPQC